ncbi:uncharacterized protein LOC125035302 isoform X2 [Penaeus chinensis]|uniref:uncharacterized protein LOC125035302 isoform X2 n=1 Tax=Penaeus chinensis TaxID=139456 RepID=UPI001FB83E28|nr:uncharacterized protein LOC125035302 isoform X2 [Penaeus chinensis]
MNTDASPVSPPVHLYAGGEQLSPPARTTDIGLASQSIHLSSPPVASVVESASMSVYMQSYSGSSATSPPPPPSSEPGTKANAGLVHISPTASCRSGSSCHSLGRFCRICHEGERSEALISPCWCMGSMGLVHKACLERWLTVSNCEKCELCHYAFTVMRKPRPLWKCENRDVWRAILVDVLCFFLLTPLAALSVYLCVVGALQYTNPAGLDSSQKKRRPKITPMTKIHFVKVPSLRSGKHDEEQHSRITVGRAPKMQDEEQTFEEQLVEWEALGLIVLAVLLLGIFTAWATAVIGYHVREWRRWRITHQDLVLVEPCRRNSRQMSVTSLCHSVQVTPVNLVSVGVSRPQNSQRTSSMDSLLNTSEEPDRLSCCERENEDGCGLNASEATTRNAGPQQSSALCVFRDNFGANKSLEELSASTLCKVLASGEQNSPYFKIVDEPDAQDSPAGPANCFAIEHKL